MVELAASTMLNVIDLAKYYVPGYTFDRLVFPSNIGSSFSRYMYTFYADALVFHSYSWPVPW